MSVPVEHIIDGVVVRVIPDRPHYAVSEDGKVACLTSKMKKLWAPHWIAEKPKADGHRYVSFGDGGSRKVDRLVMQMWRPDEYVARSFHGHALAGCRSRTYIAWNNMKQRCYDQKCQRYKCYGGRGIKVCERWHIFENFLADMGECPSDLTLERNDPDGDYEPSNCCWADRLTQARNKRNSRARRRLDQ